MAQDLKAKKVAFCIELQRVAEEALRVVRDYAELVVSYTDSGFIPGGSSPITQGDIDGSTVQHLTPAIVQGAVSALNNIATLTDPQKANLRRAAGQPLGPRARI